MDKKGQLGAIIGMFTVLILILVFSVFAPIVDGVIKNTTFTDAITGTILNQINLLVALVILVITVLLITGQE